MKILWVEDQAHDNQSIYIRLAKTDPGVRLASDVRQALALIGSETFTVVIVDLNIPLGPELIGSLEDTDYNGKYVLLEAAKAGIGRLYCLTNFWEKAPGVLAAAGLETVKILPKVAYLDEIEKVIYGDTDKGE